MWMISKTISYLSSLVTNIFFPSHCYICHKETKDAISICSLCLSRFNKSFDTPYPFITSIYSYKDQSIKKIIHAIKYFHRKDLLVPLALVISKEIQAKAGENQGRIDDDSDSCLARRYPSSGTHSN